MRIFWNNLFDAVGVFAKSSEENEFPADNAYNAQRGIIWRTTADAGIPTEYLTMLTDTGDAKKACIVLDHTLLAADTIKIQGHASNSWGAPTVDETFTHDAGAMVKAFTSSTLAYWRFAWTKNVAATAYDIGRIFLGSYHDTETDPAYAGLTTGRLNRDLSRTSYGGQKYTTQRDSPRRFSVEFEAITQTQKEAFEEILDAVGTHTPFFFQIDPASAVTLHAEPIYARFTEIPEFQVRGFDSEFRYDATLELEEAL